MKKNLLLAISILLLLSIVLGCSKNQDFPKKLEGSELESTLSDLEEKYGMEAVFPKDSEFYELENNELGIVSPTVTANVYLVAVLDNSYDVIHSYSCEAENGFDAMTSDSDEHTEVDKIF